MLRRSWRKIRGSYRRRIGYWLGRIKKRGLRVEMSQSLIEMQPAPASTDDDGNADSGHAQEGATDAGLVLNRQGRRGSLASVGSLLSVTSIRRHLSTMRQRRRGVVSGYADFEDVESV